MKKPPTKPRRIYGVEVYTVKDLLPPIGTPSREASEQRLAEEQAKRVPLPSEGEETTEAKLRAAADRLDETFDPSFGQHFRDAADEIERLREENKRLSEQWRYWRDGYGELAARLAEKGET